MKAKLVIVSGNSSKREVKLRLPVIVGRSRDAGLTIVHPTVSRRHCELFERDGLLMVNDFGSLNGTLVSNQRVTEAVVRPGEQLTIGPLTFKAIYDPPKALLPKRKSDSSWSKRPPAAPAATDETHADRALAPTAGALAAAAVAAAALPAGIEEDEVSRIDVSAAAASAWVPPPAVHPQAFDPGLYDSGELFEGLTTAPPPADALPPADARAAATGGEIDLPPAAPPAELGQTAAWQPLDDGQATLETALPPADEFVVDEAVPQAIETSPPAVPQALEPPSSKPARAAAAHVPFDFPEGVSEELDLLFEDGTPMVDNQIAGVAATVADAMPPSADDLDLQGFLDERQEIVELLEDAAAGPSVENEPQAVVEPAPEPLEIDDELADLLDDAALSVGNAGGEVAAAAAPVAEPPAPTDAAANPFPFSVDDDSASIEVLLPGAAEIDALLAAAPPAAEVEATNANSAGTTPDEVELAELVDAELVPDEAEVSPDAWLEEAPPPEIVPVDQANEVDLAPPAEEAPAPRPPAADSRTAAAPPLPALEPSPAGEPALSDDLALELLSYLPEVAEETIDPSVDVPLEFEPPQQDPPDLPPTAAELPPDSLSSLEVLAPHAVEEVVAEVPPPLSEPPLAAELPLPSPPMADEPSELPAASLVTLPSEDSVSDALALVHHLDDEPSEIEPAEIPDFDDVTPLNDNTPVEGSLDAALLIPADDLLPGALHPEAADLTPPDGHRIEDDVDSSVLPVFDLADAERRPGSIDSLRPDPLAALHEPLVEPSPEAAALPPPDLDDALFAFDSLDDAAGPAAPATPAAEPTTAFGSDHAMPLRSDVPLEWDASSDTAPAVSGEGFPEPVSTPQPESEMPVPVWSDAVPDESFETSLPETAPVDQSLPLENSAADFSLPDWEDVPTHEPADDAAAREQSATSASTDIELPSGRDESEEPDWDELEALDELEEQTEQQPSEPQEPPMSEPSRPAAASPRTPEAPPGAIPAPPTDAARPKARKYIPPPAAEAAEAAPPEAKGWWPFARRKKAAHQGAAALHMAADIRQDKLAHGMDLAPPPPPKRGLLGIFRRKPAAPPEDAFLPPPGGPWSNTPPPVAAVVPPPIAPKPKPAPVKPVAAQPAPTAKAPAPPVKKAAQNDSSVDVPLPALPPKPVAVEPPPQKPQPAPRQQVLSTDELDEFLRDLG